MMATPEADLDQWGFTPTQRRIAALLLQGLCNKDIAHETGFAISWVKNSLTAMCRQVGASDRLQLALHLLGVWRPQ